MKQRKDITTSYRNGLALVFRSLCVIQLLCFSLYAQQDSSSLQAPIDFSLDSQGRIYVADSISRGGVFRFDDISGSNRTEIGIKCNDSQNQECKIGDPHNIFVDHKNRIFVSDATGRIVVMDQQKRSWSSLPSDGNVPENIFVDTNGKLFATYDDGHIQMNSDCEVASLQNPRGIFVAANGQVYVADSKNNQIVRINPDCKIEKFGQDQFKEPSSIYVDSKGRIYVSDTGNDRIVRMDNFAGKGWITFDKFRQPRKILVDAQDRIYVGDYGDGRIVQIDPNSNERKILPLRERKQEFSNPVDITVDSGGKIYVADESDKRIVRVDNMNGDGCVDSNEMLEQPVSICAHNGNVYVTDSEQRSVLEFNSGLEKTRTLSTQGCFTRPDALFINNNGQIFLTDLYDHAIGRLDDMTDTKKREIFLGKEKQALDHPSGIFVNNSGRIYIADTLNQRVVRMDDLQGKNWTELDLAKKGASPADVSLDSRGRLYILDGDRGRIIRVNNMLGQDWIQFGTEGFDRNQFYHPSAIFLDSQDRIYIADTGNRRIVRIDDLAGKGWITLGETSTPTIWFLPQN